MKYSVKYLKIFTNIMIFILAILTLIFVAPKVMKFFLPFVIGWVIAMIANPLVKFMEKRLKIVRKHSSMMIIIAALALVIAGVYFAGAAIARQAVDVVEDLPQIVESFKADWNDIQRNFSVIYRRIPVNIREGFSDSYDTIMTSLSETVSELGAPTVSAAGRFAKNIPSALIHVIMTIISSYFFIADREKIEAFIKKNTPENIKKYVSLVVSDIKHAVGGYFAAQFKIMAVVMVILFIGFLILGVNYAILLAILISLLDMLPFFGTGTALGPWAVFKLLSGDYRMALGLIIIYGVSQLVRQIIQPKIVGDTIGLDPLATLVFMYIGYKLMGVIGMIIAIPVGMVIINLAKLGAFDNMIRCIREIITDINEFRKW